MKSVLACALVVALSLFAQAPKKNLKDQAEYTLYAEVTKETDPARQLQLLQTWKEKYAESDFKEDRAVLMAQDYAKLGKPAEAIRAAQDVLAVNPKNLAALVTIVNSATSVIPPTADSLSTGEQAANTLLPNLDSFRPPDLTDDAAWSAAKAQIDTIAETTLGWVKMQQKLYEAAEAAFHKVVQANPKSGQVAYWLATVLYAEKKFAPALFEFARAAVYTGPGALPDSARQAADDFLKKAYIGYHGSDEGLDALKKLAADSAFPPDDLKIASITEISANQQQQEDEFLKAHPDIKLWRILRDALKADNGQEYFEKSVKDALIPPAEGEFKQFKAKVVSVENPKEIIVSVDDKDGPNGDATLVFDGPIRGKLEPGAEISFAGVSLSYTKDPFMMKFAVEVKNVSGLSTPTRGPRAPGKRTPTG